MDNMQNDQKEIIKKELEVFQKVISILNSIATDIKFIKDRQDEIYIAMFGFVEKEKKTDHISQILLQLEGGEITPQEARRQISKLKNEI
jgi:hypothetical protein